MLHLPDSYVRDLRCSYNLIKVSVDKGIFLPAARFMLS